MFTLALSKFEPVLGLFALQCHMRNVSLNFQKMKKIIFIFILNCLILSIKAQTFNENIADNIVIEFMEDYLYKFSQHFDKLYNGENLFDNKPIRFEDYKNLKDNLESWNSIFKDSDVNIDSIFNNNDKLFIISQLKSQKDYLWNIDHNVFKFDTSDNIASDKSYFRLSMPLLNESKEIIIIKRILFCGDDCGDEWIEIYKKINNKWTLISGWGYII